MFSKNGDLKAEDLGSYILGILEYLEENKEVILLNKTSDTDLTIKISYKSVSKRERV